MNNTIKSLFGGLSFAAAIIFILSALTLFFFGHPLGSMLYTVGYIMIYPVFGLDLVIGMTAINIVFDHMQEKAIKLVAGIIGADLVYRIVAVTVAPYFLQNFSQIWLDPDSIILFQIETIIIGVLNLVLLVLGSIALASLGKIGKMRKNRVLFFIFILSTCVLLGTTLVVG